MECQNGGLEWFEVLLVVIGAILGFLLSIVTIIVNKVIDRHGKICLFYKLVCLKGSGQKAGIRNNNLESSLIVPLYFEFQNTSNTTRVIRDVCLYLYKDGKKIAKMVQIQYSLSKETQKGEVISEHRNDFGGEKNSYSFVLPPLSIQKQECEFVYKIATSEIDKYAFDEIRFSYFDEKNRIMECVFYEAKQGWKGINFKYENEYFELKCHKRKHR